MIMIKLICLVGLISNKVSKIIVLTMVSSLDYFLNGLIKGVDAYLTKETTADDIYNCILDVSIGDRYLTVPDEVKRRTKE